MRASFSNYIKIACTGFIVLTLFSLSLFWLRWFCETSQVEIVLPDDAKWIMIEPSGLVPDELENDPNVTSHSLVSATLRELDELVLLGITDYIIKRIPGGRKSNTYLFDDSFNRKSWSGIYFDEKTGQVLYHYNTTETVSGYYRIQKEVKLYAGPEGVSETPDKKIGRFYFPVAGVNGRSLTLYDKKLRRFFSVDFNEQTVVKGPQLSKNDNHKPVQIGELKKHPELRSINWQPPLTNKKDQEGRYSTQAKPIVLNVADMHGMLPFVLVLDETGRIDLLDREKLEFIGVAGYLPSPQSIFPSKQQVTSEDLMSYEVLPLAFNTDDKYRGMFVAGVNREGTALILDVYNENGEKIAGVQNTHKNYDLYGREYNLSSSSAIYFNSAGGPLLTVTKYILENLHPLVLSVASYFTADSFEATSGHRALFILPNTFIAMKGRDIEGSFVERFIYAFLIILPSIILSIFLVWRINKDAVVVGLSKNERLLWIIGTFAFGLVGYITYRLTRPRETLVTCQNCGKPRRPDMDRCHRCNSKWHVPELTPPLWRVVG